jgi:hypothetical protein
LIRSLTHYQAWSVDIVSRYHGVSVYDARNCE